MNDKKYPHEPVPEPKSLKKRKKEEEYFKRLEAEKIKALKEKLKKEEAKYDREKETRSLQWKLLVEAIFVFIIALILTKLIIHSASPAIAKYSDLILAGLWLYLPAVFMFRKKENLKDFALSQLNLFSSLRWFFLLTLLILPFFYFLLWIGAKWILKYKFQLTLPAHFFNLCIFQLLLVAFPEEWFFRAYLQGRLNQFFGRNKKFFSAQVGWGLVFASLFFAFAHFSSRVEPVRLLVFFPALIFGWLREKTNSLLASVLFHFICNLSFIIFQISLI